MARAARSVEGFRRNVFALNSSLGMLTRAFGVGLGVGAVTSLFSEASREADILDASIRKLQGTAKITGVDLAFLQSTASAAERDFGLAATTANDLTTELTKLTQKAGQIDRAGDAMRAFLDLGAARGLSATATLQAVQQSILGIDEGTDKLFNANPSVLYQRFAEAIGTTAGKLTDAQKAQALLNAALEDGGKVVGEYEEYLRSAAGQSEQLATELSKAQAELGKLIAPARLAGVKALTATLQALFTREGWSETTNFWKDFFDPAGAQGRAVDRGIAALIGGLPGGPSAAGGSGGGDPAKPFAEIVDELEKEVKLLEEARSLGLLRAADIERARDIESLLRREMEGANRSLEERVQITRTLSRLDWIPSSTTLAQVDAALSRLGMPELVQQTDRVETGMERLLRTTQVWLDQLQQARDDFTALGGTLERVNLPADPNRPPNREFGESMRAFQQRQREHFEQIADAEIRSFNERIEASREVLSAFGDLANATGELSAELSRALRAVEAALGGLSRFREGQALSGQAAAIKAAGGDPGNLGMLGTAAQISGILSVGGAVLSVVDTFLAAADRAREARRQLDLATKEWADSLLPKSAVDQAIAEQKKVFADLVRQAASGYGLDFLNDMTDPDTIDRGFLEALAKLPDRTGKAAREMLKLLDIYDRNTAALKAEIAAREAAERAANIRDFRESAEVRLLVAQGLDEEAEALQRSIDRREELARAEALGDAGLIDFLHTLYGVEDAAIEAAKATAEAARQFDALMTGFEISARRAALDGNDREAFVLRAEADARREIAHWEDVKDSLDEGQFEALVQIIGEELVAAVEDFDKAVNDLRANMEDDLTLRRLIQQGDDRGAALFENQQEWDQFVEDAVAAGMGQDFIDSANEYFAQEAENINAAFDSLAAEALIRSVGGTRESEDAITRNARSITSMQASTITDILWSQLSVQQEIASLLRGGAVPVGVPAASAAPTTIQNTGQQIHVHLHAGNIIGPEDVVDFVYEGVTQALGTEAEDAAEHQGTAFL